MADLRESGREPGNRRAPSPETRRRVQRESEPTRERRVHPGGRNPARPGEPSATDRPIQRIGGTLHPATVGSRSADQRRRTLEPARQPEGGEDPEEGVGGVRGSRRCSRRQRARPNRSPAIPSRPVARRGRGGSRGVRYHRDGGGVPGRDLGQDGFGADPVDDRAGLRAMPVLCASEAHGFVGGIALELALSGGSDIGEGVVVEYLSGRPVPKEGGAECPSDVHHDQGRRHEGRFGFGGGRHQPYRGVSTGPRVWGADRSGVQACPQRGHGSAEKKFRTGRSSRRNPGPPGLPSPAPAREHAAHRAREMISRSRAVRSPYSPGKTLRPTLDKDRTGGE